ncbi:MAG: family 43 glycosylhydrolase [Clostridiales bacterium]|nr:family 43 glycosylhydrolase [Clostridiales bacterium]
MNAQAFNPYLPSYEYIPDGEPHLFDGRVYIYGSHDLFDGASFCLGDYVCWSAPKDDLTDWRYEGVIYKRSQDPHGKRGILNAMYAPDVCRGKDGRYYLYYFIGYKGLISVAVCDTPADKYEFLGFVKYADGTPIGKKKEPLQFDPGVFVDDDGKVYLYTGFGPVNYPAFLLGGHKPTRHGAMCFELDDDMLTVKGEFKYIGVKGKKDGKGTAYEGHEFFEASSMRKFDGKYYFIYSSFEGHELCWAVSDRPDEGFEFGGTLVSIGDVGLNGRTRKDALNYLGNTHGSIIELGGKYYVFYHRQTNRHQFSRQACAEQIEFRDGKFIQAEVTSCGLNGRPLIGRGTYSSHVACNLFGRKGAYTYGVIKKPRRSFPYFTQYGKDRESNPDQHIANFTDGATAVFKYFEISDVKSISVTLKGKVNGAITVTSADGKTLATIPVDGKGLNAYKGAWQGKNGTCALTFTYCGKGRPDFISFTLE